MRSITLSVPDWHQTRAPVDALAGLSRGEADLETREVELAIGG